MNLPSALQDLLRCLVVLFSVTAAAPLCAQVLQIPADTFPELLGEPVQPYSFFSVRDGRLEPVPHQWMAFTAEGYPAFRADDTNSIRDDAQRIEAHDRLLLRREDGGPPLQGGGMKQVVGEIIVEYPGETLFFYVVKNAYRQATQRYVKFDPERMVIKTTDYSLSMRPGNILAWEDFHYRGYKAPSGNRESILDTLKIRMSAGLFTENNRLVLDNSNLSPRIEERVEGPLAWALYVTTRVKVAGVPVLKIQNYFLIMPRQNDIHSRFTLPGIAQRVMQNPGVSLSLDGNHLLGGELMTSWTGDSTALVDGRISTDEEQMRGKKLGDDNWIWFSSNRGFDLLAQLTFAEGFSVPANLLYEDSLRQVNEPERFPGQLPNVGFYMEDLPFGKEFYFLTRLYFSKDSDGLPAPEYARKVLAEPDIGWHPSK